MDDVKVLLEGYAERSGPVWRARPNTVLISSRGKKILVDPGNSPRLRTEMELRSIWPEEIDTVFITHNHVDHTLNAGSFPEAQVLDGEYIYREEEIIPHDGVINGTSVRIIRTPGHSPEHASLIIDTEEGRVSVAGDLFWWEKGKLQRTDVASLLFLEDPFAVDRNQLIKSRRKLLNEVRDIIPGHGKRFRVGNASQ